MAFERFNPALVLEVNQIRLDFKGRDKTLNGLAVAANLGRCLFFFQQIDLGG